MSKGEYRLSNLHLTPLYATPVHKHLAWIETHIGHNRCISGGKLFRFGWIEFLLFIFALLVTCSLCSALLCAINPTVFEALKAPFKRGLAFLFSWPKSQINKVDLSIGEAGLTTK